MAKLEVRRLQVAGAPCLSLSGRLDFDSAPAFRKRLLKQLKADRQALVLDLAGLTLLDTGGLATLIEAHNQVGQHGVTVVLMNPSEHVREALETSGTAGLFTVARNEEQLAGMLGNRLEDAGAAG
jgi:anti-anti-sigma factor